MNYYQVAILIPVFNPDEKLLSLLEELRPIFKYIVIEDFKSDLFWMEEK